jgi:hypothetical protein
VSKYVVVCKGKKLGRRGKDGLDEHAAHYSGWIDDNRAQGGDIRVECFEKIRRFPSNHVTYRFACQVCIGLVWERDDGSGVRSRGGVFGRTGIAPDGGIGDERGRNVLLEAGTLGTVIDKFAKIQDQLAVIRFPVLPAELEARPDAEQIRELWVEQMRAQPHVFGGPDTMQCGDLSVGTRYVIPFEVLDPVAEAVVRDLGKDQ